MSTEIDHRVSQVQGRVSEIYNKAMADHANLVADAETLRLRNIAMSEELEQRDVTIAMLTRDLVNLRESEQRLLIRFTELMTSMNNAVVVITNAVEHSKGDFNRGNTRQTEEQS